MTQRFFSINLCETLRHLCVLCELPLRQRRRQCLGNMQRAAFGKLFDLVTTTGAAGDNHGIRSSGTYSGH